MSLTIILYYTNSTYVENHECSSRLFCTMQGKNKISKGLCIYVKFPQNEFTYTNNQYIMYIINTILNEIIS